ncbi:MAG: hypothetical protein AAFY60_20440, partial [Myxococcota bacterium]
MTRPIAIDDLSEADWKRLDAHLERLLEMSPSAREHELKTISREDPQDAELLRRLLRFESEDAPGSSLGNHLESALRFIAKHEALPTGTRLGPWRIVRPIGRGGMAEVYLAERADGAFERHVALKVLWPGLVTAKAESHVRQERQILADLDDPRIADL